MLTNHLIIWSWERWKERRSIIFHYIMFYNHYSTIFWNTCGLWSELLTILINLKYNKGDNPNMSLNIKVIWLMFDEYWYMDDSLWYISKKLPKLLKVIRKNIRIMFVWMFFDKPVYPLIILYFCSPWPWMKK